MKIVIPEPAPRNYIPIAGKNRNYFIIFTQNNKLSKFLWFIVKAQAV